MADESVDLAYSEDDDEGRKEADCVRSLIIFIHSHPGVCPIHMT